LKEGQTLYNLDLSHESNLEGLFTVKLKYRSDVLVRSVILIR